MFFGHKIPALSHSVNIRNKVAERARSCAERPYLTFHYDHLNNCEAYANLMTGVAVKEKLGEQGEKTACCVACLCCFINCIKIYRPGRKSLKKVVAKRLKEAADEGKMV